MTNKLRRPLLVNLTWATAALLVLGVLYVLSYAPFVRLRGGIEYAPEDEWGGFHPMIESYGDGRDYPAYKPVDWLIDRTPLRRPLFQWAGLFDVRSDMELAHSLRTFDPGPPPRDDHEIDYPVFPSR